MFFGRTRAVSDILQALRQQATDGRSFVLILGMSGGGKSSVVRAGVLPMLTRPGVIEGIGFWRRAVFRPTDVRGDIFAGLAKALLREDALPSLDADGTGPDELAQVLRQSPQAATAMVRNALAREAATRATRSNGRLALVIDQMEEMFTHEEHPAGASRSVHRCHRCVCAQRPRVGHLHAAQRFLSAARRTCRSSPR